MTPAALLTLAMTCAPAVHPDTIDDIASKESSFDPLAIGITGGQSIYPKSVDEALKHVKRLKNEGKNFSVGVMQINKSNFNKFGVHEKELFDPCKNLYVAEKLIIDCYKRGGTLKRALSCYYSGDFDKGQRAESSFSDTSYIQRIGYTVPSTKVDKAQEKKPEDLSEPLTFWPHSVVRGNVAPLKKTASDKRFPDQVIRGEFVNSNEKEKPNEIN